MVSTKISATILNLISFSDPQLLEVVEKTAATAGDLARAGFDFDAAYPDESGEPVASSILRLAENFAQIPSSEVREQVQEDFKNVFAPSDMDQEKAGEMLFVATLDFVVAATALNDLIASRTGE